MFLFYIIYGMVATKNDEYKKQLEYNQTNFKANTTDGIKIIVIDGCEYICFYYSMHGYGKSVTHKGNCKNH